MVLSFVLEIRIISVVIRLNHFKLFGHMRRKKGLQHFNDQFEIVDINGALHVGDITYLRMFDFYNDLTVVTEQVYCVKFKAFQNSKQIFIR